MVRIINYNLCNCIGKPKKVVGYGMSLPRYIISSKKTVEGVKNLLSSKKPDIVGFTEIDAGSFRSHFINQIDFLSKGLGFNSESYESKYLSPLFYHLIPIIRKQCNALISRFKFKKKAHHYFSRGVKKLVLEVELEKPRLSLYLVHLALTYGARKKQLEELSTILSYNKNKKVVMGDFNLTRGEKELNAFLGKNSLFSASVKGKSANSFTFPSWKPKKQFDFVLVSKGIRVKNHEIIPSNFSDHLPVMVDLEV